MTRFRFLCSSPRSRQVIFLIGILLFSLACQVIPTPPALNATPRQRQPAQTAPSVDPSPTPLPPTPELDPAKSTPSPVPGELMPIPYQGQIPFAEIDPQSWQPDKSTPSSPFSLPYPIEQIPNRSVADGLTLRQRNLISQQGFVIVHSQEAHFNDLRQRVSLFYGQPYFLTTDAAYHALRITQDELLSALEREELHRRLLAVIQSTLNQVLSFFPLVADSDLEADTRLAAAYLSTALKLLDPGAPIDAELEPVVIPQVEQVLAGRGIEDSRLIPGFQDDFSLYKPSGHSMGDPVLEAFYRGKTWLERVDFPPANMQNSRSDEVPLLITLALRQAKTETGPAAAEWVRIIETLNYFSGVRTNGGPAEYALLMDQAFGRNLTILGLKDIPQRELFRSLLRDQPFPRLNPPAPFPTLEEAKREYWSFLGYRQQLDAQILENLAYSTNSNPDSPQLPAGGLELMAVLGAPSAISAMGYSGAEFRSSPEEIARFQQAVSRQSEAQWSASARNLWLQGYQRQFSEQKELSRLKFGLPFQTSLSWIYKELNSALGSWAGLLSGTSNFVPFDETPGAPPLFDSPSASPPAPGFVEPNPAVFYQLSRLAFISAEGLKQRDMTGIFRTDPSPNRLNQKILEMLDLADRLQRLGDIAAKELSGETLTASDFAVIQAPLGPAEMRVFESMQAKTKDSWLKMPPVPGVSALDFGGERILQIAAGGVDRIYVLVPLNGQVVIAQGGVFSYYEFSVPRNRKLDQVSWLGMLGNSPPEPPGWISAELYLREGTPLNVLAYRIGDLYEVKPAAGSLSLRSAPGQDNRIAQIAAPGEILQIIAGPVEANGLVWWEVRVERESPEPIQGWIYENQDWIERAWRR